MVLDEALTCVDPNGLDVAPKTVDGFVEEFLETEVDIKGPGVDILKLKNIEKWVKRRVFSNLYLYTGQRCSIFTMLTFVDWVQISQLMTWTYCHQIRTSCRGTGLRNLGHQINHQVFRYSAEMISIFRLARKKYKEYFKSLQKFP